MNERWWECGCSSCVTERQATARREQRRMVWNLAIMIGGIALIFCAGCALLGAVMIVVERGLRVAFKLAPWLTVSGLSLALATWPAYRILRFHQALARW